MQRYGRHFLFCPFIHHFLTQITVTVEIYELTFHHEDFVKEEVFFPHLHLFIEGSPLPVASFSSAPADVHFTKNKKKAAPRELTFLILWSISILFKGFVPFTSSF